MKILKSGVYSILAGLFIFALFGVVRADNVNRLEIVPSVLTGRYYCQTSFDVKAIYNGSRFTNCMYFLSGDWRNNSILYKSRGPLFESTDTNSWNGIQLFQVAEKKGTGITESTICSTFYLSGITTSITGTTIKIVDNSGSIPTSYNFLNTDDQLNLAYGGADTLTGVSNMKVVYELCPCELDNTQPTINRFSHVMSGTGRYSGNQVVKFLVYDKNNYNQKYWTSGKNLNQAMSSLPYLYTGRNLSNGMDNQEGINSGTIEVKIYSGNTLISTLTRVSGLTIQTYTGNISGIPRFTWDGNNRGYRVSFNYNFSVEQPITIVIKASDNILNNGSTCVTNSHTKVYTGYFNNREKPTMTLTGPINNQLNVLPRSSVSVQVADSWAGINTGTLKITIPAIYSGSEMIMPGYTYSGSDLRFDLISGTASLGGASVYKVTFTPVYEFPVSTWIQVTGYVKDLVGEDVNMDEKFQTRADCSFYGCINYVDIYSGFFGGNLIQNNFTGSLIIITGTIAPYPYLTGDNHDTVMCGPTEIKLDGNIDIENWSEGNVYPFTGLYVTGLDFEYDPETGVITPIY